MRGFSLIEILLATALLATGLALAFGIVQSTGRASAAAERLAGHNDQLRTVQGLLRRQWAGALPQAIDPRAEFDAMHLLRLEPRRIDFVATMPGHLAHGGAHLQTLRVTRGERGLALWFEYRMMTPEGPLPPSRPPELLLDGLAEVGFAARGFGPDGRPAEWTSRWELVGQLPQQLRLEARFVDPRRNFPTLVVPLRHSLMGVLGLAPEAVRRDPRGEDEF